MELLGVLLAVQGTTVATVATQGATVATVALRMRAEARKHGVPILENKPVARALKATGKVGRAIPVELYDAAAKIIAHVMQIRARAQGASA